MKNGDRSHTLLGICGAALVIGFFMPWLDIGGVAAVSGWQIVKSPHVAWTTRMILALCPIGGAMLAAAGFAGAKNATSWALGMGAGVLGYLGFKIAWTFLKVTGLGLWLVIAAAVVALVVGLATRDTKRA